MEMTIRKKQDCVSDICLRRPFFFGKSIVFVRNDFFLKMYCCGNFVYEILKEIKRK